MAWLTPTSAADVTPVVDGAVKRRQYLSVGAFSTDWRWIWEISGHYAALSETGAKNVMNTLTAATVKALFSGDPAFASATLIGGLTTNMSRKGDSGEYWVEFSGRFADNMED